MRLVVVSVTFSELTLCCMGATACRNVPRAGPTSRAFVGSVRARVPSALEALIPVKSAMEKTDCCIYTKTSAMMSVWSAQV